VAGSERQNGERMRKVLRLPLAAYNQPPMARLVVAVLGWGHVPYGGWYRHCRSTIYREPDGLKVVSVDWQTGVLGGGVAPPKPTRAWSALIDDAIAFIAEEDPVSAHIVEIGFPDPDDYPRLGELVT
jgi:hypothetical protein